MVKHASMLALACGVGLLGSPCPAQDQSSPQPARIVVVVNTTVPVSDISLLELREIVLGQRRFWPNGDRVELIVESTASPARQAFVEKLSEMTEAQFQHYWTSLIFSHRATRPPRNAPDRRLALALVNAIPGAMALVEDGDFPGNVRVITVDGLHASAPGYPF